MWIDSLHEMVREQYRHAWNLPYTREVLAHISNVMLPAAPDLCPDLGINGLHGPALLSRSPIVLRVVRNVFDEYQRQLWDPMCVSDNEEQGALNAADVLGLHPEVNSFTSTCSAHR